MSCKMGSIKSQQRGK
uniref:Uncharacterized protein n=1 Tax=Anguilla anguilla TaxID=7936 RepID=A0A0E9S427_ANGAN